MRVCGRIHALLTRRLRAAKKENDRAKGRDRRSHRTYVESAKQLYTYVRLLELCQHLKKDVDEMHGVLNALSESSLACSGAGDKRKN